MFQKEMSSGNISFEEILFLDLSISMFDHFNRHQNVFWCWRKKNGKWILQKIPAVEEWNKTDIISLVDSLTFKLRSGSIMLGALMDQCLVGFASVEYESFGPDYEYIQLSNLHVSFEHRRKGIGKTLFKMACNAAKRMGAKKLYISAHSSEETQAFFKSMKCVEAAYYSRELYMAEPCNCQLECVL
jgi:ribosomal protein S18 acetylase RimI-like enzyme